MRGFALRFLVAKPRINLSVASFAAFMLSHERIRR